MTRQDAHEPLTLGERVADGAAATIGSWRFVIGQSVLTLAWIVANTLHGWSHWDAYPYVLLNLCYSFQAGFTGPILLLASNRQAAKDRAMAQRDDEELGELAKLQSEQMQLLADGREHDAWMREHITAMERRMAMLAPRPRGDNPHIDHALPEAAR